MVDHHHRDRENKIKTAAIEQPATYLRGHNSPRTYMAYCVSLPPRPLQAEGMGNLANANFQGAAAEQTRLEIFHTWSREQPPPPLLTSLLTIKSICQVPGRVQYSRVAVACSPQDIGGTHAGANWSPAAGQGEKRRGFGPAPYRW